MRLSEITKTLRDAGIENARGEARMLFEHFTDVKREHLFGIDAESNSPELISAVKRRAEREPLQYILGYADFYRERYTVTPDCLIPRQDTEVLVELATKLIPEGENMLDLCTGSGCIAISTAKNTKGTTAVAVDISEKTLSLAKKNAEANGVADRIEFLRLDVTERAIDGKFYAILSNPPYVTPEAYEGLEKEIFHEPKIAFVGGEDGLYFYRRLTELYKNSLKDGGFIAYEIGYDQSEGITEIAKQNGMTSKIINDLGGNPRVAILKPIK